MLLNLLFPRRCLGCGKWGRYFCQACLKIIKPIEKPICPVCQKSSVSGVTHFRCQTKYSLDGLTSIYRYQDLLKKAIIKLKYQFVTDLAEELIDLTASALQTGYNTLFLIRNSSSSALIPVPLHPRRERQRGFNQAELLGRILAEKMNWRVQADILQRHKYTSPQVKLKGKERRKNVKGVFEINPGTSRVSRIAPCFLLFDDVWTTGSTLRECGNVLKRAGAKKVWGLALAR